MTDKQPNHWHILYIEDDQDDFLILKSMLAGIEEKSIQIDWAQTIQAGQEKIRTRLYDAVLVDYDLGAETGIEIIRDFHAAYPVPFILFTAHDSPEFDQQAQQAGATLFLTKGEANPRLLERVIRYAIERKQTSISFSQIQDQLYQLFELSPDAVLVQSVGRYRFANSAALRLFRAEQAEQILGPDLMDFVHPEDRALIRPRVNQVNQKRLPVQKAEFRLCVLDGSVLFVESVATPILYENKPAALVILRDVTERKGFELTITQSEQRFHGLITAFAQVVYRMSPDWQMMRQLIGGDFLKRSEADNPDWWNDYIPPEEQEMVMGRIIHSIRTGEAFDLEHRVIKADGSIGWVQSRAVPIKNDQGEIVEWFGAASNITQRKQVEEEIADDLEFTRLLVEIGQRMVSEDNLQKIFEEILDAAIRFTQADAGVVQILNPETQLLNVLASRNLEKDVLAQFNRISSDQKTPSGIAMANRDRVVMSYLDQKDAIDHELFRLRLEAGFQSGQATPLITRSGKLIGMIATLYKGVSKTKERAWHFLDLLTRQAADLFERLQTQAQLRESELRFRTVADETPMLIFVVDQNGTAEFINKAYSDYFGVNLDELRLDMRKIVVHPDDQSRFTREISDLLQARTAGVTRVRVRNRGGEWRWIESYWQPRFSEQGQYFGMSGSAIDIHEQVLAIDKLRRNSKKLERANLALQESEHRFRAIADETPLHIAILDQEGRLEFINKAHTEYYGSSLEKIQQEGWQALVHPQDRKAYVHFLEESFKSRKGGVIRVRTRRKDGKWRWIEARWQPRFSEQAEFVGMAGSSLDIHDQIMAEEKQREYAAELERINHALRESEHRFSALADGTPVIIYVVDKNGKMEFINKAYSDYFDVSIEEIQSRGWQVLIHPDDHDSYINLFFECLREQKPGKARARVCNKNGEWHWVESYWAPRLSDEGAFLGLAGSAIDIQDQIHAEENQRRYAQELERSNQALRDFTSIASHDLQEPLRKIQAFGRLLERKLKNNLDGESHDYLGRMVHAATRMQKMIDGLLLYARISSRGLIYSTVDLNRITREVLTDLEVRIQETGAQIHLDPLPTLRADALQMTQLLQNLIINAIKFHRPDEKPVIRISSPPVNDETIEISVEDNGIGFDMQQASEIFEPFTRLHSRSRFEGTGMGLSVCKKIVSRHNGSISVLSAPGKGSVFIVRLPK